jgi:hypothetical protein
LIMNVEVNFIVNSIAQKIYNDNIIYMDDNTTFEIEFFNRDRRTVCPKIEMNGEIFKSMPLVYPGQKFILKDFIDIDRKFLFKVYKAENSKIIDGIIKNNGLVKIEFFYDVEIVQSDDLYPSYDPISIRNFDTKYKKVNINLDYHNSDRIEFKILPVSFKPRDIFCKRCYKHYKEVNFNYCPNCGQIF